MPAPGRYAQVTWFERIKTIFTILPLPFVIFYRLIISPFNNDKHKSWRRVLTDASFRYMSSSFNVAQMQDVMGTTLKVFLSWARKNKVEYEVDEFGDDARLMWLGKRSKEKVVFYIHGGTYCLPIQDFALSFWHHAIQKLQTDVPGDVGFVALNYSLIPTAYFPTQLKQVVGAIHHLTSTGIAPRNIHLVGESAGGALILQLASHALHPYPNVDPLPADIQFGGLCIMSPWVALKGDSGSFQINSDSDALPAYTWGYLGQQTLPSVSAENKNYLEASKAPEDWFQGVDRIAPRILVTVGEKECLRDDVLSVAKLLKTTTGESFADVYVQENGVHNDQYLDFLAGEGPKGELTPVILNWLHNQLQS